MGSLGHKKMAINTSVMTFGVVPRAPLSETPDSKVALLGSNHAKHLLPLTL